MHPSYVTKPLTRAGIYLGVGMGGLIDGILFHQILQIHNMLTGIIPKDTIPHLEINMVWDGVFHAVTWIMTAVGLMLLFRAQAVLGILWSGRVFVAALFLGWGLFNLIEGIVFHHILNLHHVYERLGVSIFDYLYLLSGAVFSLCGWFMIHSARARAIATQNAKSGATVTPA